MMKPILPLMIFVFAVTEMQAQSVSAAETVKGYSVAQKRLLLWSTAGFTNIITQNNLDRDSVILIASRVTGLPVLMAYDDKYDSLFEGARLINAGKVVKAVALLNTYRGEEHIELLTELAIWYLHKAGSHKMDLDSANYYIRRSLASATTANSQSRYRCLALLGEYYRQNGNEKESKAIYLQILAESQREGIQAVSANAWKCLGSFHQMPDSIDCTYLNNARALYHKLQLKEREIEAIWDLMQYHVKRDMSLLHNDLIEMLNIQQSIGYKHTLFAENLLAWQLFQQSKLSEVLQHANLAIENMKWSGMTAVEGAFYIRVGSVYGSLGEDDEAISFYMKAIQSGTQENHVYWYKALFHITPVMYQHNRLAEGLEILKRVSRKYPPLTVWEKGQLFTTMADCNLRLHQYKLADQHFTSFLDLLARNPGMDPYDEFADDYLEMINFYLSRSNIKKAQLVAKSGQLDRRSAITISDVNNYLLYKIDSASGNYKSALDHYIKHKLYFESRRDMEQQMAYQAVISKSATDKKNNDIKLLQKEKQLQAARLLQANNTRNWIVGALAFAVILAGLLFYNSTAKQRTNQKLKFQASEIEVQNHQLRHLVIEKDWLVKEIHHRVKNNLQMIIR